MSTKIAYFVHATTTDNEQNISTGWALGELSKSGIQQAKVLKNHVYKTHFDVVFCSDLKRAIDSAHLYFSDKYPIICDKRLREVNFGDLNQHPDYDFNPDQKWYINNKFPNGECYKDVENRIAEFLQYLRDNYSEKHIAIVSHRAPQLALEVLLRNKTWEKAIDEDWRIEKKWQAGWEYYVNG